MLEDTPHDDVRREVAFHIGMKTEELVSRGWTEENARAEAERLFGSAGEVEAECVEIVRRHRRTKWRSWRLDGLRQDLRFGLRMLVRRPAFTIVAVLTLALGIGANAAVFSVIQTVLLEPLPYPSQGGIVELSELTAGGTKNPVAEPNYMDWKTQAVSFEAMATVRGPGDEAILGGAEPVRRPVTLVSGEFFGIMGMAPEIGRLRDAAEVGPGIAPTAVVSHRFWVSVLRGERDLATATVSVLGVELPITAVMPEAFDYPTRTDVWVTAYPDAGGDRTSHNYQVIARLLPGVSLVSARREMESIGGRLARAYAGNIDAQSVSVTPLAEALYGSYRTPLLLLLCAAAAVLLVACTNLASSMLARAASREREVALRVSVGASRGRVARQFLTESVLLAAIAGAVGLALAMLILRALQGAEPSGVLRMRELSTGLSTLAFTLAASMVAAVLFGVLPAMRSSGLDVATLLRGGDRGASRRSSRSWDVLVAGEVALCMMLLAASGLLVRSFRGMLDVEQGFDASDVVAVNVFVPRQVAAGDTAVARLETRLLEAMRDMPGVVTAGLVSALPGTAMLNGAVEVEGMTESAYAEYRVADEGYFDAMRIPIVSGRPFDAGDQLGSETVALVDDAFARRFFPGDDPIGRRLRNLRNDGFHYGEEAPLTIVGVVGSVRPAGQMGAADPMVYVLHRQRAFRARNATLTLRRRGTSTALTAGVREVMAGIAPDVPYEILDARSLISAPLAGRRFAVIVVAGFGLLTLLLAAVGIHGVVTWSVRQRSREMGIRIALGAAPSGVALRVVAEAMRVVGAGVAIGLAGAIASTRLIGGFLIETGPLQPVTLAIAVLLLGAVALAASGIPALHVARIDPLASLRSE